MEGTNASIEGCPACAWGWPLSVFKLPASTVPACRDRLNPAGVLTPWLLQAFSLLLHTEQAKPQITDHREHCLGGHWACALSLNYTFSGGEGRGEEGEGEIIVFLEC